MISAQEAWAVYYRFVDYEAVKNKRKYDPTGREGFCFARAILAHANLVASGVDPNSIKKIWAVGQIPGSRPGHHYPFHVATMVHTNEGWLVLDTVTGGPTYLKSWIEKFYGVGQNVFFVANADRFSHESSLTYRPIDFFNTDSNIYDASRDYYRGYFHDAFGQMNWEDLQTIVHPEKRTVESLLRLLEKNGWGYENSKFYLKPQNPSSMGLQKMIVTSSSSKS